MSDSKIPEKIKHFIYKYIDSVELLEILLYLHLHSREWKTAAQIDRELKTQLASITKRLVLLKSYGLVEESSTEPGSFKYFHKSADIVETVALLSEEYKIRQHQIYEIIFSQKTHLKSFADAFVVIDNKDKKGDENG